MPFVDILLQQIAVDMMFLVCSGVVVDLEPLPMHQRHAFGLERLAEMSGKLVEQAYDRAIKAYEPQEKDRASLVFDRLARGYRLTVSLEARFARDVRREDREITEAPAQNRLPRPLAAPRPERPAPGPTEADHESEMEAEETSDALTVRVKDLSHILEDQAQMLDPDGSHRADLDALAQWWAIGQRYEPGAPEPPPRRTKRRQSRPPRPRDVLPKDVHSRDADPRDIPDLDLDDEDDEPLWLESG